ncbi:MAG: MFS transporter [Vicinamibacteria bacterium]|nr:MFS transporter [Vicinamibacteria bacterium]
MKKVKNKLSSSGKKKTSSPKAKSDKKAVKVKAPAKSKAPKGKAKAGKAKPKPAPAARKRSKEFARRPVLRTPVPSPLPQQHVAAPQPTIVAPARSMPPREEVIIPFAPMRPAVALPTDFEVGGVVLVISYSIRDGRRADFLNLISDLKPLLISIGGTDFTLYEDRSRVNYFMEIFRFRDEAEFTAFDDKFHKDRKIAAIYGLLDEIVEAEKSDFKIYDRRL